MIPYSMNPFGVSAEKPYKKRLQFIESDGAAYLNAGVKPDFAGGDKIEIRFSITKPTGASPCIFGSRETGVRNGLYCLVGGVVYASSSTYSTVGFDITTGTHSLTVDDSLALLDGEAKNSPLRVTVGLPMFIFALNNYGTGIYGIFSGMKLFEWRYWRGGALAQRLIPALDWSDVACAFDTVTKTFFYNAGTGNFNYA